MKIEVLQKNLLNSVKIFFKLKKFSELELSLLGYFYLCPFAPTKGNSRLFFFFNKIESLKIYIYATINDLIRLLHSGGYSTITPINFKSYKTIIVNWGYLKDFNNNGEFYDKHLNVSSKNCLDVMWYIIYLDDELPKKISGNIVIVHEKKQLSLVHYKNIFINFFKNKKKLKFLNQEFSHYSTLANYIYHDFGKYINVVKKIIMPYEGQPYQNAIFKKTNEKGKQIQTVGYIHSFPIGLPSNLAKRPGHPKKLIANSLSQKYSLVTHLGWKKNEIKIFPSARFKKKVQLSMKNKIFLPITIFDHKKIINSFEELIEYKKTDFSNFEIRNHPSCISSKKHIKLIELLKKTIAKKIYKKKNKNNFSVFIGPTGSIIEALERNLEVFHICEKPVLESYSKKIWKYLNTIKIKDNLFKYKKIEKNKLLIFNSNSKIYKKYIY